MQIFSSFWVWLGTLILVCAVLDGVANIVSAVKCERKVRLFKTDDTISLDIENAKQSDVDDALDSVAQYKKELNKLD